MGKEHVVFLHVQATRIPDVVVAECSEASLTSVENQLKSWNQQWQHVLGCGSTGPGPNRQESAVQHLGENRTNCKPMFDPSEAPIDITKTFEFSEDSIVPTESLTEFQRLCLLQR